jgi:hypothetical protein
MKNLQDASENLINKLISVLDYAVGLKQDGIDPMIPFAFVYVGETGSIKSFVGDTPEYADKLFEKTILEEKPDYVIYAYDGYLTVGGKKNDAILLKAFDKSDSVIYLVGQRFVPKQKDTEFETIGNPAFLGTEENILMKAESNYVEHAKSNVVGHSKSRPWWKFW